VNERRCLILIPGSDEREACYCCCYCVGGERYILRYLVSGGRIG